jgi:hypothetical protein
MNQTVQQSLALVDVKRESNARNSFETTKGAFAAN